MAYSGLFWPIAADVLLRLIINLSVEPVSRSGRTGPALRLRQASAESGCPVPQTSMRRVATVNKPPKGVAHTASGPRKRSGMKTVVHLRDRVPDHRAPSGGTVRKHAKTGLRVVGTERLP